MKNLQAVQSIYAAFGRGDIPAILSHLHSEVAWDPGMSADGPPWLRPRTGRADVANFFATLAALDFKKFEPKALLDGGDCVMALIDIEFVVKATGRVIREDEEAHVWHFNGDGLVTVFRHKVDTHQHWTAWQATS